MTQDTRNLVAAAAAMLLAFATTGAYAEERQSNGAVSYASTQGEPAAIFLTDEFGKDPIQITRPEGIDAHPSFSPDGRKIAFSRSVAGNFDTYVMNTDGSGVQRLTTSAAVDLVPSFSHDGKRIAALVKGLLFGPDGAAFSPTHTRNDDRLYGYYVSQTVLKHGAGRCPVARVPAAEIEAAVIQQIRRMLRAPEVVVATWRASQPECEGVREALAALDPLRGRTLSHPAGAHCSVADRPRGHWHRRTEVEVPREGTGTDGDRGRHHDRQGSKGSRLTDQTVTITVPFTNRKRGGRKLILTPEGACSAPTARVRPDSALLKALARGLRWKRMLQEVATRP
jgi:hypothetical protein